MRKILASLCFLLATAALAQAPQKTISVDTTISAGGACVANTWRANATTLYKCVGGVWTAYASAAGSTGYGQYRASDGTFSGSSDLTFDGSGNISRIGAVYYQGGYDSCAGLAASRAGQLCYDADDARLWCWNGSAWGACQPGVSPAGSDGDVQVKSGTALGTSATRDLDGDSTLTADWNADGAADETGVATTNLRATGRVIVPGANRYDITGDGVAETIPIDVALNAAADSHAALYGIPRYYRLPALYDPWNEDFMGRALVADFLNDGICVGGTAPANTYCTAATAATVCTGGGTCPAKAGSPLNGTNKSSLITQCAANNCVPNSGINYFCITTTDATDDNNYDVDNDGSVDFAPGDVFTLTTSVAGYTTRGCATFRVITPPASNNGAGAGTDCPTGIDNKLYFRGNSLPNSCNGYDADNNDALDSGIAVVQAWKNDTHPTNHFAYHINYRLGYASRDMYGVQGPNLVRNGQADYDATTQNWSRVGGLSTTGWTNSPAAGENAWLCHEGTAGSGDCFYGTAASATDPIISTDAITVQPGETYTLRFNARFSNTGSTVVLHTDPDGDGVFAADASLTYTMGVNDGYLHQYDTAQNWRSWTIPEGRHAVKIAFLPGALASNPTIDDVQFVQSTTWQSGSFDPDAWTNHTSFLINDPGDRTIIITGDSWAKPTAWGDNAVAGLAAALNARFGRTITSQIKATGMGGQTTAGLLTGNICTTSTWTYGGGSENCWYAQIERYKPLYVVVYLGTNDAMGSVAAATYATNMMKIAHRIAAMGAIPILVGPSPVGANASAGFTAAHNLRNALLLKWRAITP